MKTLLKSLLLLVTTGMFTATSWAEVWAEWTNFSSPTTQNGISLSLNDNTIAKDGSSVTLGNSKGISVEFDTSIKNTSSENHIFITIDATLPATATEGYLLGYKNSNFNVGMIKANSETGTFQTYDGETSRNNNYSASETGSQFAAGERHLFTMGYSYTNGTAIYCDGTLIGKDTGLKWTDSAHNIKTIKTLPIGCYADGTSPMEGLIIHSIHVYQTPAIYTCNTIVTADTTVEAGAASLGTVYIPKDKTLTINAASAVTKVMGKGTLVCAAGVKPADTAGLNDASNWTGTVEFSGAYTAVNFGTYGNLSSLVSLNGWSGWIAQSTGDGTLHKANLKIEENGFTINNCNSGQLPIVTGELSGSGPILIKGKNPKNSNIAPRLAFKEGTGTFKGNINVEGYSESAGAALIFGAVSNADNTANKSYPLTLGEGDSAISNYKPNGQIVIAPGINATVGGEWSASMGVHVYGTISGTGKIASALTYGSSEASTFDGVISGTGAVTLNAGTLTLTGKNTTTGAVTVNSGATLNLTGSWVGTGDVNVHGTISGNGNISGIVKLQNGATLDVTNGALTAGQIWILATDKSTLTVNLKEDAAVGTVIAICGNETPADVCKDLTTIVASNGFMCKAVATEPSGAYKIVLAKPSITLPTAPANTTWVYNGETVSGSITVDYNTDVALTLKAADGYLFADGSSETTVALGAVTDDVTASLNGVSTDMVVPVSTLEALQAALASECTYPIVVTESITIPADAKVTLDLNGKTVKQEKAQTAAYSMIVNKGTLTISDSSKAKSGVISYADVTEYTADVNYASNTICNYGVLNIMGGTIENISSDNVANYGYPHAIDVYQGSTTNISGGIVKSANYDAIRMFCNSATAATIVNISGGEIINRISFQNPSASFVAKGELNITGGTFTSTTGKANVRLLAFGTDYSAMEATISGGTFDQGVAISNFSGVTDLTWTPITGGTFKTDVSAYLADGYTLTQNDDGTYGVAVEPTFPEYVVLPEDITAVNCDEKFGDNTVTDGTNYYATLQAAVEAVCGTANATLYCKPEADVGSLQHAPVTATLTVYGNNASVTGNTERDFDIGNTDPNAGKDITADMTLTVNRLNGCGAWGAKATSHTVNLVFNDCANMGKVFLTGTTGTLNITMTNCTFEGVIKEAVYSNADGTITLTNVAFSNLNKAVNCNHKATGTQTLILTECSFTDCGADIASDQIPVRVLSSVEGGKTILTVSGCTFTGTPEGGADVLLDYGVGETTATVSTTAANVTVETEANVGTNTAVTAEETKEFTNILNVAYIGTKGYATLAEAVAEAESGATITLMAGEHTLPEFAGKELTFKGEDKATTSINDYVTTGSQGMVGSSVHFEDLTINGATKNYMGLYHTNKVTYKNCNINGIRFLYSPTVSFEDCAFNAEGVEHSFWTYGASTVTVTNCTFTYTDRAVNCYSESGASHELDIAFTGCTFTYAGTSETHEGAVEINSSSVASIDVTMDDCSGTDSETVWFNSQWDAKKGQNTVVTVDGEIVWQVLPVAKVGDVGYYTLQEAIDAAADGAQIDIVADIELTAQDANPLMKVVYNRTSYCGVYIPDDKTIVLELNGHTISYVDAYGDCDNVMVLNLGNLTINDAIGNGKITYKPVAGEKTYTYFYSTIFNCGTLTVNAGTIENTCETETDVSNAVDNHSRLSHEYDNDCILTVNGGTLIGAYYYAIRQYTHYFEGVKNRVTINAGTIKGGIYMQHGDSWYYADASSNRLNVDSYLTINGGIITVTETSDLFGKIKVRLNNPDNNAYGLEINGGTIGVPIELLVQKGYYYVNGVSGTTAKEETAASNTSWLETNGGFISGGTFTDVGTTGDVTTDLTTFLSDGFILESSTDADGNTVYGVVVDPAYGKLAKIGDTYYDTVADALADAQDKAMTEVTIVLVGETTKDTQDLFDLCYKTAFDKVVFQQEDATTPYYLLNVYTGSRNNGGKFIFDGVNIVVTDQYMFEGNVELINNAKVTSTAEANCFIYYADVIINAGSSIKGVIEDIRGGTLTIDGGKTDGTFSETPGLQDAILAVNWSDSKLVLTNGAYVKVNSANEIGRLTVNGTMDVSNSKVEACQWIAVNEGATLTLNGNSNITTKKITGAGTITIDATGMTAGTLTTITADASEFTGTLTVVNADTLEAKIVDGVIVLVEKPVASITAADGTVIGYATLAEAIAAAQTGDEVKILKAGTYTVPTGKDLIITGAVDGVVFDNIGARDMGGASVTFNNVIFDYYPNTTYTGLQRAGTMEYNNCTINGQVFLYGTSETFNTCTFNQNSADAYNVWTYDALEVTFNECIFNSAGKAVLVYNEGGSNTKGKVQNITVTASTFTASASVDGKAAIEMDSSLMAGGITLAIDTATTATGFSTNTVSGSDLWNNKKGNTTDANNDITVTVGGETVLAPVTFVAKICSTGYTSFADALAAAEEGNTITLLAPVVVEAGEILTLDKAITITYTSAVAGEDMFTNKGTIVIDGATLVYTNTDTTASNVTVSTISCEPGATLEVKAGKVQNDSANNAASGIYAYAIDLVTNGSLGNVTATISGGEVISTNYMAIRQFANSDVCKNTLTVTDGTIKGATRGINIQIKNNMSYTTISGGTVEGGNYSICFLTTSENLSVTGGTFKGSVWYSGEEGFISGGTFDAAVYEGYCAEGYVPTENEDGTYGVRIADYVAQVGEVKFETLQEAVDAATDGATVTLLEDVELSTFVTITKSLTLDLAKKSITRAVGTALYVNADVNVTIAGEGAISGTQALFINQGAVVIENGTFHGTAEAVYVINTGKAEIKGGTFSTDNNDFVLNEYDATRETTSIVVIGGTFKGFNPENNAAEGAGTNFCADGYAALPDLNGNFIVGAKPTATVNDLGAMVIAAGKWKDTSWNAGTTDMPLSFVMQFLADQTEDDMEASPFADWYGDFVITFTGIEEGSFTADDCYLAGHYGAFGWVKVPVDGMQIEEGVRYPVMLGVGMGQKYDYICSSVEDFKCAMYLTPEILAANPNLQVKLELSVVDSSQDSDAATSALVNAENIYEVNHHDYVVEDFTEGFIASNGKDAFYATIEAIPDGTSVTLVSREVAEANATSVSATTGAETTVTGGDAYDVATLLGGTFVKSEGALVYNYDLGISYITYVPNAEKPVLVVAKLDDALENARTLEGRYLVVVQTVKQADGTILTKEICDTSLESLTFDNNGEVKVYVDLPESKSGVCFNIRISDKVPTTSDL